MKTSDAHHVCMKLKSDTYISFNLNRMWCYMEIGLPLEVDGQYIWQRIDGGLRVDLGFIVKVNRITTHT